MNKLHLEIRFYISLIVIEINFLHFLEMFENQINAEIHGVHTNYIVSSS